MTKDQEKTRAQAFVRLLKIMEELREQCPWDKKQTLESLHYLTIEETYELADAILEQDLDGLKGELGDLFLHLVFYSKIGEEKRAFDVEEVLNAVCDKLIERHPHIYGDVEVANEEEVKANWEKIKLKNKKNTGVLSGVPKGLPALVKAQRIQEKAAGIGFDWPDREGVFEKVQEELNEFEETLSDTNKERQTEEFGDILFSLINYARFIGVNPEEALERTNKKFIARFSAMEKAIQADKRDLKEMDLASMDQYWNKIKDELK
jgi:XTP/dITP diphosphohydrolase